MKTKILFINAINYISEVETRYPNLGIGYLISSIYSRLGRENFEIRVTDRKVDEEIAGFKPDIIGLSCVSQNYNYAKEYARLAGENHIPVIIGGVHISVLPESMTKDMQVACIGEGEETIVALIGLFRSHGGFSEENLKSIDGIAFWKNGEIIQTRPRGIIKDLDNLPLADRSYFKPQRHTYMFSSRGCPFRCWFCSSSRYWEKPRFVSAGKIVEEIRFLYEKKRVELISFYDDLFVADKKRLLELEKAFSRYPFLRKIKYTCNARASFLTEEVAEVLKKLNFVSIGMGLESGNERILKFLKGDVIKLEDNIKAVNNLKKHKIFANASFVFGCPDETYEEIMDTYNFIKRNPVALFDIYLLTPLPGTPAWDYALKKNLVRNQMKDWSALNVNFEKNFQKAIILSENFTRDELVKIYNKFRKLRFFKNVSSVWNHPLRVKLPEMAMKFIIEGIYKRP